MLLIRAAALLCSTSLLTAAATSIVHESRESEPTGFISSGPAPSSQLLSLRIGLKSQNVEALQAKLIEISTPSSTNYRKHLTVDEVNSYLAPSNETVTAVSNWLSTYGFRSQSVSSAGDWLSLNISVADANNLLDAQYNVYMHQAAGESLVRTLSYSLPSNLTQHIDVIHPTITFDLRSKSGSIGAHTSKRAEPMLQSRSIEKGKAAPSVCNATYVTPACVQALYNIPTKPATQSTNRIGISAYELQYANQTDLAKFLKTFRPDMNSSTTFKVVSVNDGPYGPGQNYVGYEANLDTQYVLGLATDVPAIFYTVGDYVETNQTDLITDIVDLNAYLLADKKRPQTVTTSYGIGESDVSDKLNNKVCNGFMSLGAVGTSMIFASGDGGVADNQGECGSSGSFAPSWPSSCPYVTSIGATTGIPETAASFSGGGFSNYFGQPSYQSSAVSAYLSYLGNTNSGLYNASGRAYPDVSAIGYDIIIVGSGYFQSLLGTSASAPMFASIIALINDRLIAAGEAPLGFLNPLLYSNPSAFNDITTGSNSGCDNTGFSATTGWDPVTGLGTPNFDALLAAAGL